MRCRYLDGVLTLVVAGAWAVHSVASGYHLPVAILLSIWFPVVRWARNKSSILPIFVVSFLLLVSFVLMGTLLGSHLPVSPRPIAGNEPFVNYMESTRVLMILGGFYLTANHILATLCSMRRVQKVG